MNETPMCFQQNNIYNISQNRQDLDIELPLNDLPDSESSKNGNFKIASHLSFCGTFCLFRSRLLIISIISCIIGSILLRISYIPTSSSHGNSNAVNFIGNIESKNGEKINFAKLIGLIFLAPAFVLIFQFYAILLNPFHKKLAPPEIPNEYECEL